jgi:hypothetical protein
MAQWVRKWESSKWVEQVDSWVSRVLETYGVERTGALTPYLRSLSSALFAAPTQAGTVYLKAPAPARRGEAEVVAMIAPHADGHVVAPLAVEPSEGWILSPANGHSLADQARAARRRGDHSTQLTARIMSDAAATQRALTPLGQELDVAGLLTTLMPIDLDYRAQAALERHTALPAAHPLSLSAEDAESLLKGMPRVSRAREVLVAARIPETLVPGALALSDILVPDSRRAPVAFAGWGGARWTHPFSWIGPLVEEMAARGADGELTEAVDAYLDCFAEYGDPAEMSALFSPAEVLSTVQRHENVMDLLLASELDDQAAGAPEAFRLLSEIFGTSDSRRHRH